METAKILGVNFNNVTLKGAVDLAMDRLREHKKGYVVTPNSEIVYVAQSDLSFLDQLNRASLVLPDGIGVVYAAKILGQKLSGKVAGVDFAESLMYHMSREGMRLFLLGAKPGVAEDASKKLTEKYPGLIICGTQDGYFKDDQIAIDAINAAHPDVAFICLGAPKQERFMAGHFDEINATMMCGLGGSLDVFAGTAQRAPKIFIKLGLEWFYRLLKEPWRIGRMMSLPKFMLLVIRIKLFGKGKK